MLDIEQIIDAAKQCCSDKAVPFEIRRLATRALSSYDQASTGQSAELLQLSKAAADAFVVASANYMLTDGSIMLVSFPREAVDAIVEPRFVLKMKSDLRVLINRQEVGKGQGTPSKFKIPSKPVRDAVGEKIFILIADKNSFAVWGKYENVSTPMSFGLYRMNGEPVVILPAATKR